MALAAKRVCALLRDRDGTQLRRLFRFELRCAARVEGTSRFAPAILRERVFFPRLRLNSSESLQQEHASTTCPRHGCRATGRRALTRGELRDRVRSWRILRDMGGRRSVSRLRGTEEAIVARCDGGWRDLFERSARVGCRPPPRAVALQMRLAVSAPILAQMTELDPSRSRANAAVASAAR